MRPSRRQLLQALAATAAASALPRPARAASPDQRNFLFVTCFGGWDPTRSILPAFDNPRVSMERLAEPWALTPDLTVVDHPGRMQQREFFRAQGDQLAVVHGILVPSVSHMACLQLVRTGSLSGDPDWPAILASEGGADRPLPHLAISGPSYPAELSPFTARTGAGGQLEALVRGEILEGSDPPVTRPTDAVAALQADLVAARRDAALLRATHPRHQALLAGHGTAGDRVAALRQASSALSWDSTGAFPDDCLLAAELLGAGLSRCVSIGHPALWDSHSENELYQNNLWEETFLGLRLLTEALADAPGRSGGSLADETVVVVMSEMGRSPALNANNGKDHWPYASLMLWGPGVRGGRAYGGYDEAFRGAPMDLQGGGVAAEGAPLGCVGLGATLLKLGGVDPGDWVPTEDPLDALIEG